MGAFCAFSRENSKAKSSLIILQSRPGKFLSSIFRGQPRSEEFRINFVCWWSGWGGELCNFSPPKVSQAFQGERQLATLLSVLLSCGHSRDQQPLPWICSWLSLVSLRQELSATIGEERHSCLSSQQAGVVEGL